MKLCKRGKKHGIFLFPVLTGIAWFFTSATLYAANPENAYLHYQEPQPVGASIFSTIAYIVTLLLTIGLVIVLAYFSSKYLGRKLSGFTASGSLRILATYSLGHNRAIYVVDLWEKILVLGVTENQINLLQEITNAQVMEKLRSIPQPDQTAVNPLFQKHLTALEKVAHQISDCSSHFSEKMRRETKQEKR